MSLRKLLLKEHSLSVDDLLDKIHSQGIESLSDMEMKFLQSRDKNNFVNDVLDSEFEGVETIHINRKSFDRVKKMTMFMNKDGNVLYEYDPNNKTFYIPDDDILFEFFKDEESNVIKYLKDVYKIDISTIKRIFVNR